MAKRTKRASKCKVVFERDPRLGVKAVLMWRGRSLNYLLFPRDVAVPTARQRAAATKKLMKGCADFIAYRRRSDRRIARGGTRFR